MMSPYGPSFRMKGMAFSCSRQNTIIGKTKTSVFPLPVYAIPMRSRPDNLNINRDFSLSLSLFLSAISYTVGMPCIWIGVGRMIFFCFNASRTPWGNFISWWNKNQEIFNKKRQIKFTDLESTEWRRYIITFCNDIVHIANSFMTIIGHSKNWSRWTPTELLKSKKNGKRFSFQLPRSNGISIFDTFS